MSKTAMSKLSLVTGLLCVVLAIVILVFAEGLRRWYSGLFFALIGVLSLVNARRWRDPVEE
jgi:hypothetical protein